MWNARGVNRTTTGEESVIDHGLAVAKALQTEFRRVEIEKI